MENNREKLWSAGLETLAKQIFENESFVLEKWHEKLKNEPDYGLDQRLDCFETSDILCRLDWLKGIINQSQDIKQFDVNPLVERVRSNEYSISDLYLELSGLQSAIQEIMLNTATDGSVDLGLMKGCCALGSRLNMVFQKVLQCTSLFYELSIEKGITGFCQIDTAGRIVYANPTMSRLAETKELKGLAFDMFFSRNQQETVKKALHSQGKEQMIRQLQWKTLKNRNFPVGLELATVFLGNKKIGCYAKVTNLEVPIAAQNRIFDEFPIGIVRLDQNRCITYSNQNFRDLLELDCKKWQGMPFESLLPENDEQNRKVFQKQLKKRFEGKSDEYELKLRRQDDNRTVPVMVSASPEKDLTGNVTGTMGIVRTIVRDNMLKVIEEKRAPARLMKGIAKELLGALAFDNFHLALFSPDTRHARNFFTYSPHHQTSETDRKWWAMTPGMIEWASRKTIQTVPDIKDFYRQPEFAHLAEDPFIQSLMNEYTSFIYYPVFKKSKVVACAVIYSKSGKRYGSAHKRLMEYLPLKAAILSAIHYDKMATLRFNINLIKKISSLEDDITGIAKVITQKIARKYQWENVSVFKADRNKKEFRLLKQAATSAEFHISSDYRQPLDTGVLGAVFSKKATVNIGDVKASPWNKIYIPTADVTRSELSIPIQSGDLFWILNIEDRTVNAFSRQEQEQMEALINGMGVFLERAWLRSFLTKSVHATSDAVIQTDFSGRITMINQAALTLLGYDHKDPSSREGVLGKPFSEILADKKMGDYIIDGDNIPNTPVSLQTRSGKYVKVLLSKFRLHKEFSTNIIIAKDLSAKERLEELHYLKKLYSEIAFQTKTPITLISTWLKKLEANASSSGEKEYAQKAIKQLRSLELTFDRLALFDRTQGDTTNFPFNPMPMNIREIQTKLTENIPAGELERVTFDLGEDHPLIMGDLFQVCFCFETILSYLFRSALDEQNILIRQRVDANFLHFHISGPVPMLSSEQYPTDTPREEQIEKGYTLSQALMNMALGAPIIRQFIANHSGSFDSPSIQDHRARFHFSFPLAKDTPS